MDLSQLKNIVTIAEERSISKAAEKLYISQPALSQQLSKLEAKLGTPLFLRNKQNCSLTQAGEIYVRNATKILAIQKETYNQIYDLTSCRKGSISIGLSPGRSPFIVSDVLPEFLKEFPDVTVKVLDRHFFQIESMLMRGDLNLGFSMLTDEEVSSKTPFSYISLGQEDLYVIISRDHPFAGRHPCPDGSDTPPIDLKLFQNEEFALPTKGAKIRHFADQVFSRYGMNPTICYEVFNVAAICALVSRSNLCAIVPSGFLPADKNLIHYRLTPNRYMEFAICWNSNHRLTTAEQFFIELCQKKHFANLTG